MDRGNNKFNKERNKFKPNQLPPQYYAFNKKTRRFSPNMAYDPSQNPNLNQSEDFIPPAPYPFQNIYPNQTDLYGCINAIFNKELNRYECSECKYDFILLKKCRQKNFYRKRPVMLSALQVFLHLY